MQGEHEREQFEAAAKRVVETAPPGLSQEEFFSLVEKELTKGNTSTAPTPSMFDTPEGPPSPRGGPKSLSGLAGNALYDIGDTLDSIPGAISGALNDPVGAVKNIPSAIFGKLKALATDPIGEVYERPVSTALDFMGANALRRAAFRPMKTPGAMRDIMHGPPAPPPALARTTGSGAPRMSVPPAPTTFRASIPERPRAAPATTTLPRAKGPAPAASASSPVPPVHTNPEFVTPGAGEAAHNTMRAGATTTTSGGADDAIYSMMIKKLGGKADDAVPTPTAAAPVSEAPVAVPATPEAPTPTPGASSIPEGPTIDPVLQGVLRQPSIDVPEMPYTTSLRDDLSPSGRWHSGAVDPDEKARASFLHRADAEMNDRYDHLINSEEGSVPVDLPLVMMRYLMQQGASAAAKKGKGFIKGAGRAARSGARGAGVVGLMDDEDQ